MPTTRLLGFLTTATLAWAAAAGAAHAAVTHTVHRGETLTSVAAADGLSVAELAAANGLSPAAELTAGASLVIPAQGGGGAAVASAPVSATAASAGTAASPASAGGYLVQPGDTLSAIALRYGTTPGALAAVNGMSVDGVLLSGSTLSISGGAPVAVAAPAAVASTGGAAPTDESLSPSDVGAIAAQDGVPGSLAEAIADQESGFNNAMVSRTGATGVMQIEPGTWADLSRLDGLDLSSQSATDNVRGGVAILRSLLDQTGGDETLATAAYYQGLQSVRAHGMYADTRQYVRDVQALQSRFGG